MTISQLEVEAFFHEFLRTANSLERLEGTVCLFGCIACGLLFFIALRLWISRKPR